MKNLIMFVCILSAFAGCDSEYIDAGNTSTDLPAEVRAMSIISSFETDADGNFRFEVGGGVNVSSRSEITGFGVVGTFSKDGHSFVDANINCSIVGDIPLGFVNNDGFIRQGHVEKPVPRASTLTFSSNDEDRFPSFERTVDIVMDFDVTSNYNFSSDITLGDDIVYEWTPDPTRNHTVLVGVCTTNNGCELFSVEDSKGGFSLSGEYVVDHAAPGDKLAIALVRGYQDCFTVEDTKYCIHSYSPALGLFKF